MSTTRWPARIVGVLILSLALVACGGDDGGDGETAPTGATGAETGGEGGALSMTIVGFAFDPGTISVSGPTELTITNEDSAAHTFTLDDGSLDQEIGGGETVTVTVDVSETTGFVCRFHPQMTGTVEVTA